MYSTKLKDERFIVECITLLKRVRVIQFVVDTGARFTCCNYKELITFDKRVKETVLGMDILKQLTFVARADDQTIYFCKDKDDLKQIAD